ncbi:MAG: hypothetical protein AABM30_04145 [Actinomycetota bacterium]
MRKKAEFGVVFCGGGPATLGPFVCAARTGRLDELLDRGVLVIERGQGLGGGSLRHYTISSNSLAVAFLEGLDEIPESGPFDDVRGDAATAELRKMSGVHAPLQLAGAYLDSLGAAIEAILESHSACAVARETTVREVRVGDRGVAVATENGAARVVRADKAVIAMGGRAPDHLEKLEILPGLTLEPYAPKVRHASALFDERICLPRRLIDAVRTSGRVAVIGGSHSAWSLAWLMMNDPRFRTERGMPPTVTLMHRSPIRLFYLTTADAEAEQYPFDPKRDVCPVSGRVNRVAGLKGDARELARRALGFAENGLPIRLLRLGATDDGREAAAALGEAGLVVAATGYEPQLPELFEESGARIEPARSSAGLVVTGDAEVVDRRGRALPGVLSYGLGVGIRAPKRVGGEPSNERAITSVWLYQHDVGRAALSSLLGVDDVEAHAEMPALSPGALGSGF